MKPDYRTNFGIEKLKGKKINLEKAKYKTPFRSKSQSSCNLSKQDRIICIKRDEMNK